MKDSLDIGRIYLVPVGAVNREVLNVLASALRPIFEREVDTTVSLPLDRVAYCPERGQYRSDLLLAGLERMEFPEAARVLAVIDADCYTPGLNFVFGQARRPGRDALLALARLREDFHGMPEDAGLFYERAVKEAVQQVGHTYDLAHCADPDCVMHFSDTLEVMDRKSAEMCALCRDALGSATGEPAVPVP